MRECICGKVLLRPKERGHREREYCSDRCRQRAWRARNRDRHKRERIMQAAFERQWNAIEQDVHREDWQDERQDLLAQIKQLQIYRDLAHLGDDLADFGDNLGKAQGEIWKQENQVLRRQLAEKEAEIVRLTLLLDARSKRHS